MNDILIITHPDCRKHDTGPFHPESAGRLHAILKNISHYPQKLARLAKKEELALVHIPEYIDLVEKEVQEGRSMLSTGDASISKDSWQAALRSAGAALDGVDALMSGSCKKVFCAVRPPGHHACSNAGMGFCLFNNAAIAAKYAQTAYGVKRVLIADWDLHHGNGTQEIFWNDPSVFYFSTHEFPLYPGTGSAEERGQGAILNIPIKAGPGSKQEILHAFQKTLPKAMMKFKPDFLIISAGFDAHKNDPLGRLQLDENDFRELTYVMNQLANTYSQGKILSVLEGGYDLESLGLSVKAHIKALADGS